MPSPPLRPTKSLRTKKGCTICRDRRKKCDERRPICATCERLGLKCQFPNPATLQDRRERGSVNSRWAPKVIESQAQASVSSPSTDNDLEIISSPSPKSEYANDVLNPSLYPSYFGIVSSARIFLRTNREVHLSTHYFESFLPDNILPEAYTNFSRIYIGEEPELRDSMLACSSIHLANRSQQPPVEALKYYTRAVSALRRRLVVGKVNGSEDWLLVTTILLHCFETWRCDVDPETPGRYQHLLGAFQLLKLRSTNHDADSRRDLSFFMAESVLFHVSTLLASSSSSAILNVDSSLWDCMEVILQRPGSNNAAGHPVLGTPWELNKLVFEISKMSILPLRSDQMLERQRLSDELTQWEDKEKERREEVNNDSVEDPYAHVRRLYIICARILFLWIDAAGQDREISEFEQQIRLHKLRALEILGSMMEKSDELWNFLMRWPLQILGHTVETDSERKLIQNSLEKLWRNSSCGDVKRSLNKMHHLWQGGADLQVTGALGTARLLRGWSQKGLS